MATKAISALSTSYSTLQAGDTMAWDRGGVTGKTTFTELAAEMVDEVEAGTLTVTGNWTVSGNWTFAGTTIADLGAVTTADINGGTIDGTSIGATTPEDASFDFLRVISGTPALYLWETDATSTFRVSSLERSGDNLQFVTRDSSYASVAVDYRMVIGSSGATSHSLRVTGTERLGVDSSGITVTGVSTLDGTANTENVLPQSAGAYDLGATAAGLTIRRYRSLYLTNAPDVSSDARLKDNIQDLTEAERRAAAKIKTRTFTMRDTGKKKVGYIAQEIIEALASEGLDAFEYGLVSDGETYGVDYDAINAFRLG